MARKCGLFGVCNGGNNRQVLYLIDEAEYPGKGADCVISSVHLTSKTMVMVQSVCICMLTSVWTK